MASLKQQHYRRLMKEQKTKTASKPVQKVDHPLAKYNSLNQLSCIVCGVPIKSEILWSSHIQSRKHKDAVLLLKNKQTTSAGISQQSVEKRETFLKPSAPPAGKRKHVEVDKEDVPSSKKPRQDQQNSNMPNKPPAPSPSLSPSLSLSPSPSPSTSSLEQDSSDKSTRQSKHSKRSKKKKKSNRESGGNDPSTNQSGLPPGFFDSGISKTFRGHGEEVFYESSSESEDEQTTETSEKVEAPAPSGLPADFFDKSTPSKSATNAKKPSSSGKGALPEGFFDDPKQDAKARKVEYKDPMTEEWEKFQKTIQKEDDVSEALQIEEDEEVNEERELREVNEQVSWFTKAEQLRQRQEALIANRAQTTNTSQDKSTIEGQLDNFAGPEGEAHEEESDDDELDFDSLLNWRAKIS